uniref:START domain-containing protein n=1 Tax=Noctiluca scintillans TaxID=2966 RepID=A0A7S1B0D3_NOCSC|mmetsp:Transcript_7988/g.22023  ORF Transcript_7988/g.22023 Transcript_7988/m.22023 type:complete len:406 (+) Transcript_7988:65-1282(+)
MSTEPLCALKVGSLACFCVCNDGQENREPELQLENGGTPLQSLPPHRQDVQDLSSWPTRPDDPISRTRETSHQEVQLYEVPSKRDLELGVSQMSMERTSPELQDRVMSSLRQGRVLEASRALQALEQGTDVERVCGEGVVERIRRVRAYFDQSQRLVNSLADDNGWMTEKNEHGTCSCKLDSGVLSVKMSFELDDCDMVKAFAAWLELDVHCGFERTVPSAGDAEVVVALAGAHNPMDATWGVLSHEKNLASKEDNIWQMSAIDALDEPGTNALWVCMYTPPPPSTAKLREVTERQVQPGRTRVKSGMGVYLFTPLHRGTTNGFRVEMIMESELPSAAYRIMSWAPEFLFKRVLRHRLLTLPGAMRRGTAKCAELEARMCEGKRPELYGHIRRHITESQEQGGAR